MSFSLFLSLSLFVSFFLSCSLSHTDVHHTTAPVAACSLVHPGPSLRPSPPRPQPAVLCMAAVPAWRHSAASFTSRSPRPCPRQRSRPKPACSSAPTASRGLVRGSSPAAPRGLVHGSSLSRISQPRLFWPHPAASSIAASSATSCSLVRTACRPRRCRPRQEAPAAATTARRRPHVNDQRRRR